MTGKPDVDSQRKWRFLTNQNGRDADALVFNGAGPRLHARATLSFHHITSADKRGPSHPALITAGIAHGQVWRSALLKYMALMMTDRQNK